MNRKSYHLPKGMVFLVLLVFLASSAMLAQNRQVTGTVSDATGPLPGVNILVKGTSTGTASDENGGFELTVPADATLVFSATGYKTQEIVVGQQTNFTITMEEDLVALEEVVVTGYSVETKRQVTGAVSTVKAKDLVAVPSGNVEQQLQGRVPGLTLITNGQPGTPSQVRVRGFGAFGGNQPLYIVDGVPIGSTDFLAPDDIESTTVLKDAASASIYGARAANGVIVFTTKKGSKGAKKLSINYDALVGFTDPGSAPGILNPQEQADYTWIALKNAGQTPTHPQYGSGATPVLPDYINVGGASGVIGTVDLAAEKAKYNIDPDAGPIYQVVKANKSGTNWFKEATRVAPVTRHSLGFSGAGENARYYASFSIQDQAGILLYNDFRRYTFRINTEFDLGNRVRIGENIQAAYSQQLAQEAGGGLGAATSEDNILLAFRLPPIIPVYDEFGGYAGTAAKGFNNPSNVVANLNGRKNDRGFNLLGFGNVYAEVDILDGLTARSSLGGGLSNYYYNSYSRKTYENSENNAAFNYSEGSGYGLQWVLTNTLNYKKKFGGHSIDVLGGLEALNTGKGRNISANGQNPFSTDVNFVTLTNTSNRIVNSSYGTGVNFYSLFGRVNYNWNDKYYVTGVIRRDGSSRFGATNRYGVFPAVSAAWRISGEDFMKGVDFISDLKIRGGWGEMGNSNNVAPDNQYSLYAASLDLSSYDINGTNTSAQQGFFRSRIGNPNAKWETSTTTNIGLDGTILKGHVDIIFDLWKKETKDLLYQLPILDVVGSYASAPAVNIASMENKGIDIQVITRGNIVHDLGYEVNVTGSFLHNEITALAPNVTYFDAGNYRNIIPVRNQPGQSLSSFFGFQVIGYFKDAAEVASAPTQDGAGPGRFRYADINSYDENGNLTGKPDGKIDNADRTFLGSPIPKFNGGLDLKLTYKNFDIETYLYTALGGKIFNFSKWFTDFYPSFSGAAISSRVKDYWTPSNLNPSGPVFENVSNFSTNQQSNSWYVEDGSYLRMQYLSIGFNLPQNMLNSIGFTKLRVYASANNLFTVTKYKGLDPGVGGAADTNFGIDVGNYPVTRGYTFGVNVGF